MQIRVATINDARGILEIYRPYIENTSFTFETEVPSEIDFKERIRTYLLHFPWLVCEVDGIIAGYAYGARYRERVAYQWCVESSIYIHDDFQKAKLGQALYNALLQILKRQGFRNVYAVINLPNEKSVAFHERLGFHHFASYEKVGYKLGKWKTVGWWEKSINDYDMEPAPPIAFGKLNKDFLAELFVECEKMVRV